jgi:type II secretory pathway pseudopilin PulG
MKKLTRHWQGTKGDPRFAGAKASRSRDIFAFTLIEIIGALAIVAILASLIVPVIVRQIDRAAWDAEVTNCGAISNAIVLQVLRNKTVPGTNTWAFDTAAWLNMSPLAIATNARGCARQYLVDRSGWLGSPASYNAQTSNGTTNPLNARIILLSTIAGTLPPSPDFTDLWNTPERAVPSSWAGWKGRGEDLVIQRLNLQPLFRRVILFNRDGVNGPAYFSIDTSSLSGVQPLIDAYYLNGSDLGMYSGTNLLSTEMIVRDISRDYHSGVWTDDPGPGPLSGTSSNLQSLTVAFLLSGPASGTRGFVDAMASYMNAYSSWAGTCFAPGFGSAGPPQSLILQDVNNCFVTPKGTGKGGGGDPGPCALVQ